MTIFTRISDIFQGDSSDESKRDDSSPKRSSTSVFRPPTKGPKSVDEWWKRKPSVENSTVHFAGEDAELAKRVTMRIRTGRIHCVKIPESAKVFFLLAGRKSLTPADIAQVLGEAPDVPEALIRYILTQAGRPLSPERRPRGAREWESVLRTCNLEGIATELFTLVARSIYLGGPSAGSTEATELWDHALATGMVMDHLTRLYRFKRPILAYLTALYHDVGHAIVLWTILNSMKEGHSPDPRLAPSLCRALHEEAGLAACTFWHLPEPVTHVIGHHHQDLDAAAKTAGLQALLQLADESVLRCGHNAMENPQRGLLLETTYAEYLKLTDETAAAILDPIPGIAIQATL